MKKIIKLAVLATIVVWIAKKCSGLRETIPNKMK